MTVTKYVLQYQPHRTVHRIKHSDLGVEVLILHCLYDIDR